MSSHNSTPIPTPDVFLSPSVAQELITTARALVSPRGKGIYATDESPDVINAMLESAGGKTDLSDKDKDERRRAWRVRSYECAPSESISGIILHPETLLTFHLAPSLLSKNIIPGVRANGELAPLPHSPFEFLTDGLDGLLPQLQAARAAGARFSKWRVPIACTATAGPLLPTQVAIDAHAETLARFAALSQEAGLVPIVEPDVEFSGDADLGRSVEVHVNAIRKIYERCAAYGVLLEGTLIKPSFPQPGLKHPSRANVTPEDIGLATATVISRSVPPAVAGVVFLSGGLDPSTATAYLNALNVLVNNTSSHSPRPPFSRLPPLSFSFGRALQGNAMKAWVHGDEDETKAAFEKWAGACRRAARGEGA